MKKPRNLVGPMIRKIRYQQKISQPQLAARCQVFGWNVSRDIIAAIEGQVRCITEYELVGLAKALKVQVVNICPSKEDAIKLLQSF